MKEYPDSFLIKEIISEICRILEGEPIFALDFRGEETLEVDINNLSVVETKLWHRFKLEKYTQKHNCRTPQEAATMIISLATAMRDKLYPIHQGEVSHHFHQCPLCALFIFNILHFLVVSKSLDITPFCQYEKHIPTIRPYVKGKEFCLEREDIDSSADE